MTAVTELLAELPIAQPAKILLPLTGGPASDSFLLESGGRKMVLRVDKPLVKAIDLDRQAETEILEIVAAAGLGPEMIWADPSRGLLVSEYLEGEAWTAQRLVAATNLERLGELFRKLHALPPRGKAFNVVTHARHYAQELGCLTSGQLLERVVDLDRQLNAQAVPAVLCHNDPVAMNVIDSGLLRFIDWEYAGVGDPFFDLAVVSAHHELSRPDARRLLRACFGRVDSAEIERLEVAEELYDCLHVLWLMLVTSAGDMTSGQGLKLSEVRRRLNL